MDGSFVRKVRGSRGLSQKESADTLNRLLVACSYELAAVAGERGPLMHPRIARLRSLIRSEL